MSLHEWLVTFEWHRLDPANPWHLLYAAWNGVEAIAWFICAWFVLRRWRALRRSRIEILYGILFVLFGASDVIEALRVPSWLILAKLALLIALLAVRRHVRKRIHPGARIL
jgi:hypothetical protein